MYEHNKLVNGTGSLLLHACILRKKETHAGKSFKSAPSGELVSKSVPFGAICPIGNITF